MDSAYSLANSALAKIRRNNREEQKNREAKVRALAPEYTAIEARLTSCGVALAKGVLNGGTDILEIRRKIETAQAEKAAILKRLNLPSDFLDEIYSCKKCNDRGYTENGSRCECLKNMASKYVGVASNLTDVMRSETFKNFDFSLFAKQPDINGRSILSIMKNAYKKAEFFAETFDNEHSNLYLFGNAGTGKTYLSSCIANRAIERGKSVYYQSAFRLLDMMEKLKFGRLDEEELSAAEYASKYVYTTDLLILDDVGTEFVSSYSSAALFDIINSRIMSGKSTIVSSNLNPEKIEEIYGSRMSSRMVGSFDMIMFLGADLRKLNNMNKKRIED